MSSQKSEENDGEPSAGLEGLGGRELSESTACEFCPVEPPPPVCGDLAKNDLWSVLQESQLGQELGVLTSSLQRRLCMRARGFSIEDYSLWLLHLPDKELRQMYLQRQLSCDLFTLVFMTGLVFWVPV